MGWLNSDHGLVTLASMCATPEEAYRISLENLNRLKMACKEYELSLKKRRVQRAILKQKIETVSDPLEGQLYQCELDELGKHENVENVDYELAQHQVDFLTNLLSELELLCQKDKKGQIDFQSAQIEERAVKLLERVHDDFLTGCSPSAEALQEIRRHPWVEKLWRAAQSFAITQALKGKINSETGQLMSAGLDLNTLHEAVLIILPQERAEIYLKRLPQSVRENMKLLSVNEVHQLGVGA